MSVNLQMILGILTIKRVT